MSQSTDSRGQYILSIEPIPTDLAQDDDGYFPAYFVGSTAPNNAEDGVHEVENPQFYIKQIADFLKLYEQEREIIIVIHGYNTSLGNFAPNPNGVKGWYQSIRNYIAENYKTKPKGLVLLGYRWPSEVINGLPPNDTLVDKIHYAIESLPILLKILTIIGLIGILVNTILIGFLTPNLFYLKIILISILFLSIFIVSVVLTLFLLRLAGYFRDNYRATNFGVSDLAELIRQLDDKIVQICGTGDTRQEKENCWQEEKTQQSETNYRQERIKLSFIGHSMGGFVVTNTVRLLTDIFDRDSIGNCQFTNKKKCPSSGIGNVFSLGRLILVSPDIPAETIISGRANFLASSLRRFEEAYLFSNEGDMALKLASTAANYFNFSAKTREGGYRLGNVVIHENFVEPNTIKESEKHLKQRENKPKREDYGIINLNQNGELVGVQQREDGDYEPKTIIITKENGEEKIISAFLNYLFLRPDVPLSKRQSQILLTSNAKPIAELFTYFDCTDYEEIYPKRRNGERKKIGVVSHALYKTSLSLWDYFLLTIDYMTGKIDTHGGYFNDGDANDPKKDKKNWTKPEAAFTKNLIYGLACLGFKELLKAKFSSSNLTENFNLEERKLALQRLSEDCQNKGIQVLLAPERYNQDILDLVSDQNDRSDY